MTSVLLRKNGSNVVKNYQSFFSQAHENIHIRTIATRRGEFLTE